MPIELSSLVSRISPEDTILFFGAGASIPSGAPSATDLTELLAEEFSIEGGAALDLADIATIIETTRGRRPLIEFISNRLHSLVPVRGMLALPQFQWAGIYSTNYDDLIEKAYRSASKPIAV